MSRSHWRIYKNPIIVRKFCYENSATEILEEIVIVNLQLAVNLINWLRMHMNSLILPVRAVIGMCNSRQQSYFVGDFLWTDNCSIRRH